MLWVTIRTAFVGSDSWGSEELVKLAGTDIEGYYFSTHYAADAATPAATRFIKAYKAKYGEDITFAEAITAGVAIKASHLSELRALVRGLE